MIDNSRTGQNISAHRQRLGWTQGELARRLNVTHQAVSKWENGIALPDISTLLELSRLFGVSMELLLTGDPTFPAAPEPPAANPICEASEAAAAPDEPVAEPTYTEASSPEESSEETPEANEPPVQPKPNICDWDQIISIAPFASRQTLDTLVEHHMADESAVDYIPALAPFLSREMLDRLVDKSINEEGWADLIPGIAPFLSRQTLDKLVERHMADESAVDYIPALAPFLSREMLDRLVDKSINEEGWADLIPGIAPFLSRQTLDKLVERHMANESAVDYIPALAPFLSREMLDKLIWSAHGIRPERERTAEQKEAHYDSLTEEIERRERDFDRLAEKAERREQRISEKAMERAQRIVERNAARAARRAERLTEQAAERAAKLTERASVVREAAGQSAAPAQSLNAFSPFLNEHIGEARLSQLIDGLEKTDARRTELHKAESSASTPAEYAQQTIDLLYQSCEATDPIIGRFEEIRRAMEAQDYAALNEFSALLDRYIGPQWLEEYAALCDSDGEIPENFDEQLNLAVTQRDWNWIEDHAHLISDQEIIRRIALVSSSEGYFEFIPLFIDRLDQHSIDYAARQAVRLYRTDDARSFADRVSPGIL